MQKLVVVFLILILNTTLPGRPQSSSSIVNRTNIEKKVLNNGVTVLLIEDHSAPVISCQVYSKLGTRDEPADANGSAFLIGRSALGKVDFNYREGTGLILESDETTSVVINQDFVGLLLRGSIEKLDSMVERASSFASYDSLKQDFAAKYKTIQDHNTIESNNIGGAGESLRTYTYDRLFETAYGSTGDGHSLAGGPDVAGLTESAFLKFAAQAGAPDKLVVVIAGDIEPTYATLLTNRWFGYRRAPEMPSEKKAPIQRPIVPVLNVKPTTKKGQKSAAPVPPVPIKTEESSPSRPATVIKTPTARTDLKMATRDDVLAVGYRVPGANNPDFAALSVLAAILGGGQSSILAARFMNRDSADSRASELSCRLGPYGILKEETLFSIYLREPLSPYYSIWQSERFINDEIAKLKEVPIDGQRLTTAKKLLQAEYRQRTESIDGRAVAAAQAFLRTGDATWSDNYISAIQSVTAADVQKVAIQYLIDANRAGVTIVSKK